MKTFYNGVIGFGAGTAGGLIGLGGAELRLPYLVSVLQLSLREAVAINLLISLVTVLAALSMRMISAGLGEALPFVEVALWIAVGATFAAYVGTGLLRRLSAPALARTVFVLLLVLGSTLIVESQFPLVSDGLLPQSPTARAVGGLLAGSAIGLISSLLGVAGGEVIIPTLVFAFGCPIKPAGTLSLLISIPTIVAGLVRHSQQGSLPTRRLYLEVIAPMACGSVPGALVGAALVPLAPVVLIKVGLGVLLIWSALKVFR